MNNNEQFADWITLRTILLQSVATWILRDMLKQLEKLESAIVSELLAADINSGNTIRERNARLTEFADTVAERIKKVYAELRDRTESDFETIADIEADEQKKQFLAFFGEQVKRAGISKIAQASILGASAAEWLDKQAEDLTFRAQAAARSGMDAGDSPEKMMRRIKGWDGIGPDAEAIAIAPIITPSKRALETTIRTGVEAVAEEVLTRTSEQAPKSFRMGWQSIAVLDGRTTEICKAHAFKIWTRDFKPVGHKIPFQRVPRHPMCRSRIVPYMLDDETTKEFSFKEWIGRLTEAEQNRIFGESRMKLWRAKQLTDSDLIRQQSRALSLEDFRNE